MARSVFSAVFCLFVTFSSLSEGANTILSICNQNSDRAIYAAYMIQSGAGNGWQSNGWFEAQSNQCTTVDLGTYAGNVYLYAEDQYKQTNWGEGTVQYCVNKTNGFTIDNADTAPCTDPTLEKVSSDLLVAQAGTNTWNVAPNFSQVNFCNQNSAINIFAAIARPNGTLESKGWYEVDAGKCFLAMVGKYTGPVSYYAEYNGGQFAWKGQATAFCVNRTAAFDLFNADQTSSCTDSTLKMVSPRQITVGVGTTLVNLEAVNTDTILNFCNKTANVLQAAHAIQVNSLWQSNGWTTLQPQSCGSVDLGSYTGTTYVYAEYNLGQTYSGQGPFNFCVNRTQNFTINDGANQTACSSNISQKMVPTFQMTVQLGTNEFDFN